MSVSMSNFLPPASGDSVTALLQVLGDPKEAKHILEKMAEERKAIDNATEKQREQFANLSAQAKKTKEENERTAAEAAEASTKAAVQLGAAKSLLADAERRKEEMEQAEKRTVAMRVILDARQEKLEAAEKDLEKQLRQVEKQEHQMLAYGKELTAREAAVADKEKALADDIAENNKWLDSLRPPRRR
jgi:hypothetical protein